MKHLAVTAKSLAWSLFETTTFLACVFTVVGFLASWWWPFELACHFRVQYGWFLIVAGLFYAIGKKYKRAAGLLCLALVNLSLVVPLYFSGPVEGGVSRQLRALELNVFTQNRRYADVIQLVYDTEPDVIVLVEVDAAWVEAMQILEDEYAYSHAEPQEGNFGIAIYSRLEITTAEVVSFGQVQVAALLVRLDIDGQALTIVGSHVFPPVGRARAAHRNRQLADLGRLAGSQHGAVMLLGDLNITSWSPYFTDLLRESNLRDSRRGFGVQPTWPVWLPHVRLPIDHCLVSEHVVIHDRRVGGDVGSDHYPILIDFSLHDD